jgi:predicted GNAT family N-acyltransferase
MNFEHPGKQQIPQLLQLWKDVFGEYDGFWELFLDTAFQPDHCRCITENNQVVAGLYWFDCICGSDKIAYVYAVVTDPAHRGRGLCRKLMADVHSLLTQQGYAGVMLVPAEEGLREMYRKMGYEDCTRIGSLSCNAGVSPVQIRNIGIEEYAALRRQLLPEGSVLQEGVQLPFLAAQAQLFAGADFLLAAYLDGEKLHGMELLGNSAAAPGILRALGCETGIFQIPGEEKPFAMIHKLQKNAATPKYFGLAFE